MKYVVPRFRVKLVRERCVRYRASTPFDAAAIVRQMTVAERGAVESMVVLYLDGRSQVIGTELVALGGRHGLAITACEVFRGAILAGATAIVLGHNHPSGSPTPSPEDETMTRHIAEVGAIVGVTLVDHVVVTEDAHVSMLAQGLGGFS